MEEDIQDMPHMNEDDELYEDPETAEYINFAQVRHKPAIQKSILCSSLIFETSGSLIFDNGFWKNSIPTTLQIHTGKHIRRPAPNTNKPNT